MTLSDLASIGSFISGVAVLVSLIFLYFQMKQVGAQVKQAEKNQRAAIRQTHSIRISETHLRRIELAPLWVKLYDGKKELTDEELYQCLQMGEAIWFSIEDLYYQHRDGLLDEAAWNANIAGLDTALRSPLMRAAWRILHGSVIGTEFVDYVDARMAKVPSAGPHNVLAAFRVLFAREMRGDFAEANENSDGG